MPRAHEQVEIFLQPGEFFVGDADCRIRTLLGSCVSVTLWHPRLRIGAMSHFLLPDRGGDSGPLDARYGDEALRLMAAELARMKVAVRECEAKIFGGGDMFPGQSRADALLVGRRNGEAARRMLQSMDVMVRSESLFGIGHRQIVFDVARGDVWARQVRPLQHEPAPATTKTAARADASENMQPASAASATSATSATAATTGRAASA